MHKHRNVDCNNKKLFDAPIKKRKAIENGKKYMNGVKGMIP